MRVLLWNTFHPKNLNLASISTRKGIIDSIIVESSKRLIFVLQMPENLLLWLKFMNLLDMNSKPTGSIKLSRTMSTLVMLCFLVLHQH